MGLGEQLSKFVPDKLRPALEVTSYGDFLHTLESEGASRVTATPGRKPLFLTGDANVHDGTYFEYNVSFTGEGGKGRRINYYHPCAEKYQDIPDHIYTRGGGKRGAQRLLNDLDEAYIFQTYVTADALLQQIASQFPDCITELKDADKTFTQEDIEDLRRQAEQAHIRPW